MPDGTLDAWLAWAQGPLFVAALVFMVLGLLRLVLLLAGGLARNLRRAGDARLPAGRIAATTVRWLLPLRAWRERRAYGLATLAFHLGILVVPFFVAGHIALIRGWTGLAWPALPRLLLDVLTLAAVAAALAIVLQRARARDARALSRAGDYLLPLLVGLPFLTGFLASHPGLQPLDARAMLLAHVLSGNLLLFLVPVTKIAHCALLPFTQLASQVAWRFVPGAGARVALALGKKEEAV